MLGVAVLLMLFVSAIISVLTIWVLSTFANKIGIEIADRLFVHYLNKTGYITYLQIVRNLQKNCCRG